MKGQDASIFVGLNDPKFGGMLLGKGIGGYSHFRVPCHVEVNHAGDVHAVDVVAPEDRNHVRVGLLDEVNVLENGVGSSLVPGFVLRTHLCWHRDDEVALQQSAELPSLAQMLEQRLAAELGEHVDRVDSGIDEIAEDEIDDPIFASEGNRWLGAFPREGKEPGSFATGEYDAQHPNVQGTFHGGGGFSFGDLILRQSALPETIVEHDVIKGCGGSLTVENTLAVCADLTPQMFLIYRKKGFL